MTKNKRTFKVISYCLIILFCHLLQNTQGLFPEIGGARCFLLIPVSILLSMGEDEKYGALLGLFSGLLWDLTSGVHMGFNCIYLMTVCFLSCALVTYIARNTFITNMICALIATVFYCLLYWLFFIIIKGVERGEMTLFTFYIPCMIYTVVLTPVLWFILRPVRKNFLSADMPEI